MPIIVGVAIILIVVVIINFAKRLLRKRYTKSTLELAAELGLTFSAEQQPAAPVVPGDMLLFAQGEPLSRQNVMEGIYKGVDLAVYTYSFRLDLGKMQEIFSQTVVQIRSMKTALPQFTMCPQDLLNDIMSNLPSVEGKEKLMGTAGIRLPNYPDFRQKYKLMGPEWQLLAALFNNEEVLTAVEDIDKKPVQGLFCLEGAGQNLFIYPFTKRMPVKHLTTFINKCILLAQQIASVIDKEKSLAV